MAEQFWLILGQSRTLLDKGLFTATQVCLDMFGEYVFRTAKEEHVEGGTSKVDYVGMVDDERKVLTEAKSPSVMKALGDSLPAHGIKLEWVTRQSLESKILHKVSIRILSYNPNFEETCNCIGRFVSGSEKDGMAVPYMPQLLDCLSSRQRSRSQAFSCLLANVQYRGLL